MQAGQHTITRPETNGTLRGIHGYRRIERLIADRDTTPGKLRVARIILVLGILLAGSVAVLTAYIRVDTTRNIATHLEPLNSDVTTLYRSLADMDATAATFLSGRNATGSARARYDHDRDLASEKLTSAAAQASDEARGLITAIHQELLRYSGYVDEVMTNSHQGNRAVGTAYLGLASDLMSSSADPDHSILPQAARLQRQQADALDRAYSSARPLWLLVLALVAGALTLAGLIWAQVFVFRRTHRMINLGLVAATAAVLVSLLWGTIAGIASVTTLSSAHRHSQAVSRALGPAQIAALRARAIETNQLVTTPGNAAEADFGKQQRQLQDGLGHLQQVDPGHEGLPGVVAAVAQYADAHRAAVEKVASGAGAVAIDDAERNTATTFTNLNDGLTSAVDRESTASRDAVTSARGWWLTGLPFLTGVLALVAVAGVALGIRQRLEEYR